MIIGNGIPVLPPQKTYQLWVLSLQASVKNGQPSLNQLLESAGVFRSSPEERVQWLSNALLTTDPQRFIVTVEPATGSLKPSSSIVLDSMVVNAGQ
jgi:hypothetical protein